MTEQINTAVTESFGNEPLLPEWLKPSEDKQERVTEDNQNAPSALRGDVTVTMHTREVYRLFTGLDPRTHERTKSARASLFSFEKTCQSIEFAVQNDDPYADYYFYHLHQRLSETQSKLEAELKQFSEWLRNKLPESISYSESTSTNPTVLPVRARTKLFFLALYLAVDVDRYCRLVYLACHFALIPKTMQNQLIHDKLNAVRSITEEANKFRHTDAIRDDFASNNARARAAIERHGFVLADEFLRGDKRSTLAPEITTRPELDEQAKKAIEFATKQVTNDPLSPSTSINQPPIKAVDQVEKAETLSPETTPTSNAQLTTSVTEQPTNNTPQQPNEDAQEGLNPSREIEAQQTEKVGEYSEQPMQND